MVGNVQIFPSIELRMQYVKCLIDSQYSEDKKSPISKKSENILQIHCCRSLHGNTNRKTTIAEIESKNDKH